MEKAGICHMWASEQGTDRFEEIEPGAYLTDLQVRMMSTQPDMILQFAHFLDNELKGRGWSDPEIYADCLVSLQGQRSRPFLNASVDLSQEPRGYDHKTWILPHE